MNSLKIIIDNLKCQNCAYKIQDELSKIPEVKFVEVDFFDSSVNIEYSGSENIKRIFTKRLKEIGYPEKKAKKNILANFFNL